MRSGDDDLKHVHAKTYHHGLRAEVMQATNQPTEIQLKLNEIDAGPCRAVAGTVGGHEQDAGDELHAEDEREAAAPDITPLGATGNVLDQQRRHETAITSAMIEPAGKPADRC